MTHLQAEAEELYQILHDNGLLTTEAVVDAARDPDSALHKHFCWDNSKAADEWRKQQARQLIAQVKITVNSRADRVVRAFVSVPSDRKKEGGGYRPHYDVVADADMKAELLADMRKRIWSWQRQVDLLSPTVKAAISQLEKAVNEPAITQESA